MSFMVIYMTFGSVIAPNHSSGFASASTDAERVLLEEQLKQIEEEIAANQAIAKAYEAEGKTLKSEINSLDNKIETLNQKIKAITLSLRRIESEIGEKVSTISQTEEKIILNRLAISKSLQGVYEQEQQSLVTVLLKNNNLSDFFNEVNNLLDVQTSLTATVKKNTELRDELLLQKDQLANQKNDNAVLKIYQDAQKEQVAKTRQEKDKLLEVTQGNEQKYQQIVTEKKATASEIRSRIFRILGGGEMSFEEAYRIAKFAEGATGVEASFLLAILDQESALGSNVGKCNYRDSMASGPPDSKRDDVTHFLRITADLGLDPETTLVSCAISKDGAWGGAMGPSQFIPSTWILYEKAVARITGQSPASPWRNSDAFIATALLIKDNLNACSQYSDSKQLRCAASRYYAGGNWSRFEWTYGVSIQNKKETFDDEIKTAFN